MEVLIIIYYEGYVKTQGTDLYSSSQCTSKIGTLSAGRHATGTQKLNGCLNTGQGWIRIWDLDRFRTVDTASFVKANILCDESIQYGETITINHDGVSDGAKYLLVMDIPGNLQKREFTGNSQSITIPIEWCRALPNDASTPVLITLTTQRNNDIAIDSKYITLEVPENIKPIINESNVNLTAVNGNSLTGFIQSVSELHVDLSAVTGMYASTISKLETYFETRCMKGAQVLSPIIHGSGMLNITVKAYDSRDRISQYSTTINVTEYHKPKITYVRLYRCNANGIKDSQGTYSRTACKINYSPLGASLGLTAQCNLSYREAESGDEWTDAGELQSNIGKIMQGMSLVKAYEYRIVADDGIEQSLYIKKLPSASYIVHIAESGRSIGIGCAGTINNALILNPEWQFVYKNRNVLLEQYYVNAAANENGNISPNGLVSVPALADAAFTISPVNANYRIAKVLVDGVNVGRVSSYTFNNIRKDSTLEAFFELV